MKLKPMAGLREVYYPQPGEDIRACKSGVTSAHALMIA